MKQQHETSDNLLKEQVVFLEDKLVAVSNEVVFLVSKNTTLESKVTTLASENTDLISIKNTLESEKEALESEKEHLKFRLEQLQRMLFGAKRERFESKEIPNQLSLSFEVEEKKLEEAIEAETLKIEYTRVKVRKPHPGRNELPKHLPVEEIIMLPAEDVSQMKHIGNRITEELEYNPGKLFIRRYIFPIYITKEDEFGTQKQVVAELNRPIPKCIAGPELLAHIEVEKFMFHMPFHRQLQRFKMEGVHIDSNTMDSWHSLVSKLLLPLYAVHKAYILAESYLQVDESPIKVLDRDKPGATHQGYMWVYRSPMVDAVFFEYNKGRSANAPRNNLKDFKGYLQTDGYSVYLEYGEREDITHLACMAHARRMFDKALKNDKERASAVLILMQKLYEIEAVAREIGLNAEQRKELRIEKSLPLLNEIGKYISENRNKVLPKSPIGHAFDYCTNRWDNLMNYLKDGNLEIDNNLIENAIRPLALGRKNYLFAGSHEGAQNIAMFYSFFGTCKRHDINPHKWLAYVIQNINDTKISQLKNLLPQFIDKSVLI